MCSDAIPKKVIFTVNSRVDKEVKFQNYFIHSPLTVPHWKQHLFQRNAWSESLFTYKDASNETKKIQFINKGNVIEEEN